MPSIKIDNYDIFYEERKNSEDVLLLLHGIPVDSSLWEGVIKNIDNKYRVIAPDIIGFGKSSKPLNIEYNIDAYTDFIKKFIEKLELKNIIIVGMDLGLIIGLNYFAKNKENVKGIVMFEGMISDITEVIKRQSFINRNIIKLFKNDRIAKKAFVENGLKSIRNMLEMGTISRPEKLNEYVDGFKDARIREKILYEGVCSNSIAKGITHGDLGSKIHNYSEILKEASIPKLLLYAKPGAAISEKMVKYAVKTIKNLETEFIGRGKHFIPFDQPENIAEAINKFGVKINK